jgi:pentatricopeptide repeat protein
MLKALFRGGRATEASSLMSDIRAAGLKPTERTLNVLLTSFSSANQLPAAVEVFNSFLQSGGEPTARAYNVLINAFARSGQLLNAESLVREPPSRYRVREL